MDVGHEIAELIYVNDLPADDGIGLALRLGDLELDDVFTGVSEGLEFDA